MKVKTKVTIDGVERDIEVDLPDDQYLTREQHDVRLKDQIKKRLSRHAAELMQDEEFIGKVLTSKGIDPKNPKGGSNAGKGDDAETVERLQADWRKKELDPVKQQLEESNSRLRKTRHSQLVSDLEAAFLQGDGNTRVKKAVARKLAELEASRGVFDFDDEHEMWAVKDGDGFAYATTVTKERPYKGVSDFATDFVKNKDNSDFIERTSQNGPGLNQGGNGGGPALGNIRSRADFKSVAEKVKWIGENGADAFKALPEK